MVSLGWTTCQEATYESYHMYATKIEEFKVYYTTIPIKKLTATTHEATLNSE